MSSADARPASPAELAVVYDGQCPACSAYVRLLRLREAAGPVQMVDARAGGAWVERARAAGLSLDDGMAMHYGGRWYHGADCVHMLALLGSASGAFNRANAAIFRRPRLARALYPVLRAGRNLLLKLLRRSPLRLS